MTDFKDVGELDIGETTVEFIDKTQCRRLGVLLLFFFWRLYGASYLYSSFLMNSTMISFSG